MNKSLEEWQKMIDARTDEYLRNNSPITDMEDKLAIEMLKQTRHKNGMASCWLRLSGIERPRADVVLECLVRKGVLRRAHSRPTFYVLDTTNAKNSVV